MSAETIDAIKAKRLEFLKGVPVADPQDTIASARQGGVEIQQDLPDPPTPESVTEIKNKYGESKDYVEAARAKLSAPKTLTAPVDWNIGLFVLFSAWVVNFGLDPEAEEAKKAAQAGDLQKAADLLEQATHLVYDGAKAIDLEWIPFVDLALVSLSDEVKASGPYGGVFVSRGENPFIILSFKGTTYQKEVATDARANAVIPKDGILYGYHVHQGMYEGLFEIFPGQNTNAFELIWEGLERVAKDIKGSKDVPVPVYVTGHSLGAGYADYAYIELIRRLDITPSSSYTLHDLWIYGAPRVGLNDLAVRVKELLASSGRHLYRPTRFRDLVPTIPNIIYVPDRGLTLYKHFDGGYKLTPLIRPFVTERQTEIDKDVLENDLAAVWAYHWPPRYYEGIKKVLDVAKA